MDEGNDGGYAWLSCSLVLFFFFILMSRSVSCVSYLSGALSCLSLAFLWLYAWLGALRLSSVSLKALSLSLCASMSLVSVSLALCPICLICLSVSVSVTVSLCRCLYLCLCFYLCVCFRLCVSVCFSVHCASLSLHVPCASTKPLFVARSLCPSSSIYLSSSRKKRWRVPVSHLFEGTPALGFLAALHETQAEEVGRERRAGRSGLTASFLRHYCKRRKKVDGKEEEERDGERGRVKGEEMYSRRECVCQKKEKKESKKAGKKQETERIGEGWREPMR